MKYFIIAGEASGDLHGAALIEAILSLDQDAEIVCWGGDKMEATAALLLQHYKDIAYMGFVEVLRHLRKILSHIKICQQQILDFQPNALVLIDYPGFNLRIAKWAHNHPYKVCYYIAPQLWAWNHKRAKIIKKVVDQLYVILPFEEEFYKNLGIEANYVGHPLLDHIRLYNRPINYLATDEFAESPRGIDLKETFISDVSIGKLDSLAGLKLPEKKIIALLPGSRLQEIKKSLPIMLGAAKAFKEYKFIVAGAPNIDPNIYTDLIGSGHSNCTCIQESTYDLLSTADAAIVTSGTATLETALFNVPQIVVYRGHPISYQIAKRLVHVSYISLVNIIADHPIVTELIQDEFNVSRLIEELNILLNPSKLNQIKSDYKLLTDQLSKGNASINTAEAIVKYLT